MVVVDDPLRAELKTELRSILYAMCMQAFSAACLTARTVRTIAMRQKIALVLRVGISLNDLRDILARIHLRHCQRGDGAASAVTALAAW